MTAKIKSQDNSTEPASFEEAIDRLQELVDALEIGDVPLEQSLAVYEEGQRLIAFCQKKLAGAEETMKKLSKSNGDMTGNDENEN
jgi:exodeoxyribonuclease VII small subunit